MGLQYGNETVVWVSILCLIIFSNIKRIVFHSLMKYNGSNMEILTPSQTKQIGGRAGRYSLDHATGEVTTLVHVLLDI